MPVELTVGSGGVELTIGDSGGVNLTVGGGGVTLLGASEPGPPGASGGSHKYLQGATSTTWVIVHNLGFEPNVTLFDTEGNQILGDIVHDSINQLTVQLANAVSGVAYLS